MKKAILNIGLNNNPLTAKEIVSLLRQNFGLKVGEILDYKVIDGYYMDISEPTLIVEFNSPYKLSTLVDKIEQLCSVLTQQCIAAKIDGNGLLIYRIDYKEERYTFDENLFLTL